MLLVSFILITVSSLLCFYVYWLFKEGYKYWQNKKLPFLKPVFPFGNLQKVYIREQSLGEAFGDAYLELKNRGVKHGGIYAFKKPVYIPVDPEIIKHILISDSNNFLNHGMYSNLDNDPLTSHLFNLEGQRWKETRRNLVQAYSTAKIKSMCSVMVSHSKELQKRFDKNIDNNNSEVDIKLELLTFTTDVICDCGFGVFTNLLNNENMELLKHGQAFTKDQWHLLNISMIFLFTTDTLWKVKYKVFKTETTEFMKKMFEDILQYRKKNSVFRNDVFDCILKLAENKEDAKITKPLSLNECMAQIWIFLGAGMESSASTIAFALYEISFHTEYQERLRKEIGSVLARHGDTITYEAVNEMTYMDCILEETLRKYPLFPILPRVCKDDYKVPGTDFVLPKNSLVLVSNFGIQRDPEYYPEPLKFDPERFTKENKAKRPLISSMPFGEGPRICIGKRFALLQTKIAFITLMKNYEFTLSEKTTPQFSFKPWEIVLNKEGGIWIYLKKRTC